MQPLHILLADDHSVVRAGLKSLIEQQPDMTVIGEAGNGLEVLELADSLRPDVVVMDLSMPMMSGVQATQLLLGRFPAIRVLILSVHEDASYLRQALEVGAVGYALKRSVVETLIGAIRMIVAGDVYLDPALGEALVSGIIGRTTAVAASSVALSERENAVLRQIALGYSNKEVAAQFDLSIKTVETYKARGMEKLGLNSRVDIVRYAVEQGWLV